MRNSATSEPTSKLGLHTNITKRISKIKGCAVVPLSSLEFGDRLDMTSGVMPGVDRSLIHYDPLISYIPLHITYHIHSFQVASEWRSLTASSKGVWLKPWRKSKRVL